MSKIRKLPQFIINQIAAGEIVSTPSSLVKELIENSIDAQANKIIVRIDKGGKNLISITDNGLGIKKNDLSIVCQNYTTSKLSQNSINSIKFLGFRGEALHSISSISYLTIYSKVIHQKYAWQVSPLTNNNFRLQPCCFNLIQGTKIVVKNLFYNVPIRMKFLKNSLYESRKCILLINKFSLVYPSINFSLICDNKIITNNKTLGYEKYFPSYLLIKNILGDLFFLNTKKIFFNSKILKIYGYISYPTFVSTSSSTQYFFINGRIIDYSDLPLWVQIAYNNIIPYNKYSQVLIYIIIIKEEIDVNVNPSKTQIKFKNVNFVKYIIINIIRFIFKDYFSNRAITLKNTFNSSDTISLQYKKDSYFNFNKTNIQRKKFFLGFAKFQIKKKYIVSITNDSIVLVDQHAAHERILLESLKTQFISKKSNSQKLLIPELISLGVIDTLTIMTEKKTMEKLGFFFSQVDSYRIEIKQIPFLFKSFNIKKLIKNILENISYFKDCSIINFHMERVLSNICCNSSISAGFELTIFQMNNLLRELEKTAFSSQCNHGRPTFFKLHITDIDKLFKR